MPTSTWPPILPCTGASAWRSHTAATSLHTPLLPLLLLRSRPCLHLHHGHTQWGTTNPTATDGPCCASRTSEPVAGSSDLPCAIQPGSTSPMHANVTKGASFLCHVIWPQCLHQCLRPMVMISSLQPFHKALQSHEAMLLRCDVDSLYAAVHPEDLYRLAVLVRTVRARRPAQAERPSVAVWMPPVTAEHERSVRRYHHGHTRSCHEPISVR